MSFLCSTRLLSPDLRFEWYPCPEPHIYTLPCYWQIVFRQSVPNELISKWGRWVFFFSVWRSWGKAWFNINERCLLWQVATIRQVASSDRLSPHQVDKAWFPQNSKSTFRNWMSPHTVVVYARTLDKNKNKTIIISFVCSLWIIFY